MSFGFDKLKKPSTHPERTLDLSGLTMETPAVPVDKEKRAIEQGEKLGFRSREPSETKQRKGRVMRRHVEVSSRPPAESF